jgi:hypothetical protein
MTWVCSRVAEKFARSDAVGPLPQQPLPWKHEPSGLGRPFSLDYYLPTRNKNFGEKHKRAK